MPADIMSKGFCKQSNVLEFEAYIFFQFFHPLQIDEEKRRVLVLT